MRALVRSHANALAQADGLLQAGRIERALVAYEQLVVRGQEASDRAVEAIGWSMVARCRLHSRDLPGARDALSRASDKLDPLHLSAYGRYRQVLARLAIEDSSRPTAWTECLDYLRWAEESEQGDQAVDAALLLARLCEVDDRVEWLQRAIDLGARYGATSALGGACTELGAALDQLDQPEAALAAYEQALQWHRLHHQSSVEGELRRLCGATWAVGSCACRVENWPLARERLEQALSLAREAADCDDLAAWIRGDLARAYEAAGDIVGARHELVEALRLAREQGLAAMWPERFASLRRHAQALDVAG